MIDDQKVTEDLFVMAGRGLFPFGGLDLLLQTAELVGPPLQRLGRPRFDDDAHENKISSGCLMVGNVVSSVGRRRRAAPFRPERGRPSLPRGDAHQLVAWFNNRQECFDASIDYGGDVVHVTRFCGNSRWSMTYGIFMLVIGTGLLKYFRSSNKHVFPTDRYRREDQHWNPPVRCHSMLAADLLASDGLPMMISMERAS
jgi:hypothetical protein